MQAFYLLKPDILTDKKALDYYYKFLSDQKIKIYDEYLINNWINLSKLLYEPDYEKDIEKIKKIRKQMITTIKGYQLFYEDKALINTIEADQNRLQDLYDFKKELRKQFVYDEEKYYLVFEEDIPTDKKLSDINIENIKCNAIIVPKMIKKEGYNLVYFNKIHFPDPTKEAVNRDLIIIEENGVCDNKVKRKAMDGK